MRGGSRQSMHPGRHRDRLASTCQPCRKQNQLLQARKCIQHKRLLPQTLRHTHVAEAQVQLGCSVQGAMQRIVDVGKAQMPHAAKLQMPLPMGHGGTGLIKLTQKSRKCRTGSRIMSLVWSRSAPVVGWTSFRSAPSAQSSQKREQRERLAICAVLCGCRCADQARASDATETSRPFASAGSLDRSDARMPTTGSVLSACAKVTILKPARSSR